MNKNPNDSQKRAKDSNPDPITGEPGAHPVGTGLGAAGGGAAIGAAGGAVAGPVGAIVGAAAGAIAGGLGGKAAAEAINPTTETAYWKENYTSRPYVESKSSFDDYSPAYRYGWESYQRRGGTFDTYESELGRSWDKVRGTSKLTWDRAKDAVRDAWDRVASGHRN